jgi:hypothetical protein
MRTFIPFFALGLALGAPLAGLAAAIGGYPAAFAFAAVAAACLIPLALSLRGASRAIAAAPA